ncbi:hypothetical protein BaRGS_00020148 [Batillaria attramentaria]|uniref:Uncharacterized protein n=1 Tax=Batillaria attramentaria TaxID=370345 RepID=A0ABD0KMQ0_9CAEN
MTVSKDRNFCVAETADGIFRNRKSQIIRGDNHTSVDRVVQLWTLYQPWRQVVLSCPSFQTLLVRSECLSEDASINVRGFRSWDVQKSANVRQPARLFQLGQGGEGVI